MKRNLLSAFSSPFGKTAMLGFLFLGLNHLSAWATPSGFSYKSNSDGNWNSLGTWVRSSDGNTWNTISDVQDIPDATAGNIIIAPGHFVSITSSVNADQVTVQLGGNLILNGTLTLANNGQFGLVVDGALMVDNGGTLNTNNHAVTGGGEFMVESGATLSIGSPDGIMADHLSPAGNVGSVQVLGQRFFSGAATYIYAGTAAQVSGNGLPNPVSNVVINNAQGVALSKIIEVTSNLSLTEGKLKPLSYGITLGSGATVTLPAANKVSFVEGALAVKANSAKVIQFPIGKGTNYRPVTLTIVSTAGENTYTAEQFDQAFTIPGGTTIPEQIDKISAIRYFNITKNGSNAVTANLTLNYGTDDNVTNAAKLAMVKYGASGWEYLGGTGATNGNGAITSGNFTTFSSFMLANQTGGTNPLPVELISFSAKAQEKNVVLNWATASETNSDRFEIERSLDGKIFEKIGTIKTGSNSSTEKRYAFYDKNPVSGSAFYRLKQVDLDGTVAYSQIENVRFGSVKTDVLVYPNPAAQNLTIAFGTAETGTIHIINNLGQEVMVKTLAKTSEKVLDITALPAGTYQLLVKGNTSQAVKRFVKID